MSLQNLLCPPPFASVLFVLATRGLRILLVLGKGFHHSIPLLDASTQPHDDLRRLSEDLAHQTDLMVPLKNVSLINAQLINPQILNTIVN